MYQNKPDAVGGIDPQTAAKTGLRPGAIVLNDEALAHIEEKHGGGSDAREFVNHVLENVDAIYAGNKPRTFAFVSHGGVARRVYNRAGVQAGRG